MKATVRMKLTLGFLGLLSIGSVASLAVLTVLSRSIEELQHVVSVSDVIEHKSLEMRYDMLAMSDAMRGYLISGHKSEFERKKQADDDFVVDVEEIRKLAAGGEILKLVQQAADMDEKVLNRLEDQILEMIESGRADQAKVAYNTDYLPLRSKQEAIIASIEAETVRLKGEALASAESSYRVARATTWVLVLGVTLLGLVVSFLLARSLSRPVVRMAESMARAAKGDLSDTLEFDDRGDELGQLSRSINGTYAYLQDMSGVAQSLAGGDLRARVAPRSDKDSFGQAFVAMTEKLSQVIGEVRSGANALAGASSQVSASSQTLSQGTERAGGLRGGDHLEPRADERVDHAERRERPPDGADGGQGREDAEEGGRAGRRDGRGDDARSPRRSRSSRRSPTRRTCWRSTPRSKRRAPASTARASRWWRPRCASSRRGASPRPRRSARWPPRACRSPSARASCSRELVPSIRKTADLVQEVAAASAEQSSGVAQVNKAMSRVDQVTQRNASAAEELASTAEEMAAQAQGLEQLVAFFRVGADGAAPRPSLAAAQARTAWAAPAVVERPSRSHARTNGSAATATDPGFGPF